MLTPEQIEALEAHVTTTQAAERVSRTPAAIRQWVKRGHLVPVNPEALGPKYFKVADVLRCDRDRRAKIMELLSA